MEVYNNKKSQTAFMFDKITSRLYNLKDKSKAKLVDSIIQKSFKILFIFWMIESVKQRKKIHSSLSHRESATKM